MVLWSLVFLIIAFQVLMLIRDVIVYRCQTHAIDIASAKARSIIDSGDYTNWEKTYDDFNSFGSYNKMLFDLTKWRYDQFYPNWEED